MKNIRNKALGMLLALLLAATFIPESAAAAEAIHTDRPVSISVFATYGKSALEGVSYRLYQVAGYEKDGSLTASEAFRDCPALTEKSGTAAELAAWLEQEEIAPVDTGKTDQNGQLILPDSGKEAFPGTYLLAADPFTADGFLYTVSPLLITLPTHDGDSASCQYEITVNSKSAQTEEKTPATPSSPRTTEAPASEVRPRNAPETDGKLPQTGLLWWPMPLLVLAGLVCLLLGRSAERRIDKNR